MTAKNGSVNRPHRIRDSALLAPTRHPSCASGEREQRAASRWRRRATPRHAR
jgi:hypothetical protein